MQFSPRRSRFHRKLYRNGMCAVTLATAIWLASIPVPAQIITPKYGRKAAVDNGPRAIGLVQLSPKGNKGRLVPIAIMMDGKFYDAGSYKAMPVPMALDFDTVYEGFRTGVSQGLFTITQPGQLNHVWIAEGKWLPAGMVDPSKHKKYATPVIAEDDKDAPPVLHRRAEKSDSDNKADSKDAPKPATPASPAPASGAPASAPTPPPPSTAPTGAPPPSTTTAPAKSPGAPDAAKTSAPPEPAKPIADDETIQDPNRPRLRRGKPDSTEHRDPYTTFDAFDSTPAIKGAGTATSATNAGKNPAANPPAIVMFPAISDAGGPDPRPYIYDVKPAEEAVYRSKMLDLAAQQLQGSGNVAAKDAAPQRKTAVSKSTGKSSLPKAGFDDVTLRIFDLSNSNEPVLVLSAKTHPPATSAKGSSPGVVPGAVEEPKEITLIARTNLEGELRKLFFSETDSRHLYSSPRMDLIDAVDADGDGRGELLFRRTFDDGSAYAIYRVTADGLWPLFEGTP